MAEDEPQTSSDDDDQAKVDVKAKLAQMSGTRLRQQRAAAAARKQSKHDEQDKQEQPEPEPEPEQHEPEPEPEPEPEEHEPDPAPAAPEPAPKPKAKAKPKRQQRTTERLAVPAAASLALGLLAGCLPGIAFLVVHMLDTDSPTKIPAGAVERTIDWINCPKAVEANRWTCDVYQFDGKTVGHGEFVPQTPSAQTDWRVLVEEENLVPDGEYEARAAKVTTLYVRGVAVGSKPAPRDE